MGPFEAAAPLLSNSLPTLSDKLDHYFVDYSLIPLFVQENYLNLHPRPSARPLSQKEESLRQFSLFARAAESIALGDVLSASMIRDQAWDLLPVHGVLSAIRPTQIVNGDLRSQLHFPNFFGRLSTTNRLSRALSDVRWALYRQTGGTSARGVREDYIPVLHIALTSPLATHGVDGIPTVLETMDAYELSRHERDAIIELCDLSESNLQFSIPTQVKSAFTRAHVFVTFLYCA